MPSQALFRALPAALCLAGAAAAQQPPKPDPLDAAAPVPPAVHRSALTERPRGQETAPQNWRDANQRVHQIGGWRAYAREAQQPAAAASASAPAPAPAHHHHHGMGHKKP